MANVLRNIPSVNELLESPALRKLMDRASRSVVLSGVRDFLDNLRSEVQSAASEIKLPAPGELAERIAQWIVHEERPALRPVINATGILLHTGLGRAPLAEEAIASMVEVARDYASVELNLATGERSKRVVAVERLLQQLTGAEAAAVVNNNAGATLITLAALAGGREVIVSRGQLVEIGGSYRLPEVMQASGAILREVGTTNKTRISDYQAAIGDATAALMHVHTSNYVVQGFSESTPLQELVALGRKENRLVIDDIGSGAVWDFTRYGVTGEPRPQESIRCGADVVLFSGDKLLGGPQCGIIVGKRSLDREDQPASAGPRPARRQDHAGRAGRHAAAVSGSGNGRTADSAADTPHHLRSTTCSNRAERLAPQLAACDAIATAEPVEDTTYLGGGSVPTQKIPTWCVALTPAHENVDSLATRLRKGHPAVCGRVQNDRVLLDLRTVFARQDSLLVKAVQAPRPSRPIGQRRPDQQPV